MIRNPWCCAIYSPKERLLGIAAAFQFNGSGKPASEIQTGDEWENCSSASH